MKYQMKDYQVGELAKFYGVSPDTIRLYGKKGILPSRKNDANQYRLYSREDFIMMDYVMRLKKIDFSLGEICSIVNDMTISSTVELLEQKEEEIEQRIQYLCELKRMTADFRESVKAASENIGKVRECEAPALICRNVAGTAQETLDAFFHLGLGTFPILTISLMGKSFLEEDYLQCVTNRTTRAEAANILLTAPDRQGIYKNQDLSSLGFEVIPAGKSLYFTDYNITNGDYSGSGPLKTYIRENGIRIKHEPLIRLIAIQNNQTNSTDYYEYWVPIE